MEIVLQKLNNIPFRMQLVSVDKKAISVIHLPKMQEGRDAPKHISDKIKKEYSWSKYIFYGQRGVGWVKNIVFTYVEISVYYFNLHLIEKTNDSSCCVVIVA